MFPFCGSVAGLSNQTRHAAGGWWVGSVQAVRTVLFFSRDFGEPWAKEGGRARSGNRFENSAGRGRLEKSIRGSS